MQVYGVFIEYLNQLPEDVRKRILHLLYYDNFHLARFALRKKLVNLNDVTKDFASKKKSIDKFHFGNHVDKWCLVNCNPYQHPELNNVNTMICEQLFRGVNEHKNCKSMNEPSYFLYWLYLFDMYNLDAEGMAACAPDPRSEYRWDNLVAREADVSILRKVDDIVESMQKIKIDESHLFICKSCGASFAAAGYLDRHLHEKHDAPEQLFKCDDCDKILAL